MRARTWLKMFTKIIEQKYDNDELDESSDGMWTESIGKVMDEVGKKLGCVVFRKGSRSQIVKEEGYQEYLNIDFMFFHEKEVKEYVLPRVVIEHENNYSGEKIEYCLWKTLLVRSPVRILICYQKNKEDVIQLKQDLEKIVWKCSLMKGTDSDLLIIIGDESINQEEMSWRKYYKVFEWRNDALSDITDLVW